MAGVSPAGAFAAQVAKEVIKDAPLLWAVTLKKSAIHAHPSVRATLECLKLTKMHKTVIVKNIRPIRGMLHKVKHHIHLEPYTFDPSKAPL